MWGSAGCLVVVLAVLAEAHDASDVRKWPCNHHHDQNSPEVLQLLRKTANAFKQVGDIILTKTGDLPSPPPVPSPYGVYPHPFVYYPMPYPGAAGAPGVPAVPQVYPYLPVQYAPAIQVPQAQAQPALPAPCHAAPAVAAPAAVPAATAAPGYRAELSDQLSSLAAEYRQAAQNECSCGCGNVEVNMRQGPSSLAPGKASDIVVEVTLGDLTQTDAGAEGEAEQQKKTVNILNVSDASEGGESGADSYAYAKASSSASIEERTVEDDETNTIQVVEAINLRPETSPLQVETYDNTVAAVEDTIKKTVVVKSETEETKTIHSDNGETVINVKTYEESFPKYPDADQEISQGGYEDDVIDQVSYVAQKPQYPQSSYGAQQVQSSSQSGYSGQSSQNSYSQSSQNTYSSESSQSSYSGQSSQSPQSYQEKVEVVEVQRPKYEELKKEAGVVSEIVETVDIEEDIDVSAASAYTDNKDVSIKVVDVGSSDSKQQVDSGDYDYEYEYEDAAEDALDKDAKDLQQYYTTGAPKYASPAQGERVLAEHPHPVENVQVVVKGTSSEAYAEGLQTSASSSAGGYSSSSSSNAAPASQQHQTTVTHHHHRHGPAPTPYVPVPRPAPNPTCPPAPAPKPHVPYEVPCEAHYGLPRRHQHKSTATQYTESYSAPQQASAPAVQTHAAQQQDYSAQSYSAASSEVRSPVAVYKPAPVPSPCPPCPPCPSPSAAPAVSYTRPYEPGQSYAQQQTTYPEQSGYSSVQSVSYTRPQQQHVKTSVSQHQNGQSYVQQQTHNHHNNNVQQTYSSAQPVSYTKQSSVTQYQASQQSNSAQAQGNDQSQNYIQSQSYAQPQQQVYVQQQGSYPQQSSYSQAQQSSPQTQTYSVATLHSQSKGYSQPSQSYAAAPAAQQPASWSQAPHHQSYTSTSKQTTTTVTQQQKAQPASYASVSVEEQPSYSGYAYSSGHQQQAAPHESAAVVVESPKQSQPLYVAGKAAPSIAQRAVLDAYNQAVSKQATNKITPAQYPPYYFNAHANSIYAPPMIRSQQAPSAQRPVSVAKTPVAAYKPAAPVHIVETFPLPDEDSAEVVPERYSNSIGAPVEVPTVYSPSSAKTSASLVKTVSAPAHTYSVGVGADDNEDADEVASFSSQVAYSKPAAEDSAKAAVSRVASRQLYARPTAPAAAAYAAADSKGPTRIDLLPVASAYSSTAAGQSATSEDDGDALVAGGTPYASPDASSAVQAETVFY